MASNMHAKYHIDGNGRFLDSSVETLPQKIDHIHWSLINGRQFAHIFMSKNVDLALKKRTRSTNVDVLERRLN